MTDTIRLDPVLFDALHLSALANGGIGRNETFRRGKPCCVRGHACWLEGQSALAPCHHFVGEINTALSGLFEHGWTRRNDGSLRRAGLRASEKALFEKWCRVVRVDVAA